MAYLLGRDEDDLRGLGELAQDVVSRNAATGAVCEAHERRIRPVVEPPPEQLVEVAPKFLASGHPIRLHSAAYAAYLRLKAAAEAAGIPQQLLRITSGYRSVQRQRELWARALKRYGTPELARRWVAPPGGSPHHTGRAIDFALGTSNDSNNLPALRATPAFQWLVCNAGRFGFTPYAREPWHWEYNPPGFAPTPGPGRAGDAKAMPERAARTRRSPAASPPRARPGPRRAPAAAAQLLGFSPAEEKALRITTAFETGGPLGFGGLTGNFDGQGLSFGLLQWNIGTGSLQPLLREFARSSPARFDAVFAAEAPRLRALLAPGRSVAEQLQWARSVNDASQRQILEPWKTAFNRLAADPDFQRIQLRAARSRMDDAERSARQLGILSERGLALMFDNVTQNGPRWLNPRRLEAIRGRAAQARAAQGAGIGEREVLRIVANVVADTVLPRWRENVRKRRLTIVDGTGVVHGNQYDLGRQFGLSDVPWNPDQPAASGAVRTAT